MYTDTDPFGLNSPSTGSTLTGSGTFESTSSSSDFGSSASNTFGGTTFGAPSPLPSNIQTYQPSASSVAPMVGGVDASGLIIAYPARNIGGKDFNFLKKKDSKGATPKDIFAYLKAEDCEGDWSPYTRQLLADIKRYEKSNAKASLENGNFILTSGSTKIGCGIKLNGGAKAVETFFSQGMGQSFSHSMPHISPQQHFFDAPSTVPGLSASSSTGQVSSAGIEVLRAEIRELGSKLESKLSLISPSPAPPTDIPLAAFEFMKTIVPNETMPVFNYKAGVVLGGEVCDLVISKPEVMEAALAALNTYGYKERRDLFYFESQGKILMAITKQ